MVIDCMSFELHLKKMLLLGYQELMEGKQCTPSTEWGIPEVDLEGSISYEARKRQWLCWEGSLHPSH
jgi:hypothetical protein